MDQYRVQPGTSVDLSQYNTADKSGFKGEKSAGKQALKTLNSRLESLQELLYAEGKQKLLVVLQAMDTGGKDGVIRHVFDGVNPQGVKVASFKKPTSIEISHDYLWRVHPHTPGRGEITIFNRSHYEDVLVVRVHNLVPPAIWNMRYEHINQFERLLVDEGTTILKFFLHISEEEQKERLQARRDTPSKQWKFSTGDLHERALWNDYMQAYEAVLSKTSVEGAPWYIIPADRKWYRNLVIGTILVQTLESFNMQFPEPEENIDNIVIE